MNIMKIAKKCGLYATDNSYKMYKKELEAFAKAVIDDYKASLVPVGYIHDNKTEEFFLTKTCNNCIALYALGETKC